jgi:hypothetical protein
MSKRDKIFYAEVTKGHPIKVLIDVLAGALSRSCLQLTKKGIFLRDCNTNNSILFDIELARENFKVFRCAETIIASVNLKHLQRLVKNVKKKDSLILFIVASKPDKIGLIIRPEGGKKSSRLETNYITIQRQTVHDPINLPEGGYKYPMVIEASDFQKIKKMAGVGKIISVKMQKNNYLSFYCDAGDIYSSELSFGELVEGGDDDEGPIQSDDEQSEEEESVEEEDVSETERVEESEEEAESDGDEISDTDRGEVDTSNYTGVYEAEFYTSMFNMLVKLPGLCCQMQFYAPMIRQYPLRIKMTAGTLGHIQVYMKDVQQIVYEDSCRREQEEQPIVPEKKNSKGRKKTEK